MDYDSNEDLRTEEPGQPRKYVIEAMDVCSEDPERAKDWLIELAARDRAVSAQFALLGIKQAVRSYFVDLRRQAASISPFRIAAAEDSGVPAKKSYLRVARIEFWERYTLYGRERLRYATKPRLMASAHARLVQAGGNVRRAKFERSVAGVIPDDETTVEMALDLRSVEEMAARHRAVFETGEEET